MNISCSIGLSILFHAAVSASVLGFGMSGALPRCYVERGAGSVEIEMIVLGQEGSGNASQGRFFRTRSVDPPSQPHSTTRLARPSTLLGTPWPQASSTVLQKQPRLAVGTKVHDEERVGKRPAFLIPASLDVGVIAGGEEGDLRNPAPRYPKMAVLRGWQGQTMVRLSINFQGQVEEIRMIQSSGYAVLDEEAMMTLQGWKFPKGRAYELEVPVKFVIRKGRVDDFSLGRSS